MGFIIGELKGLVFFNNIGIEVATQHIKYFKLTILNFNNNS